MRISLSVAKRVVPCSLVGIVITGCLMVGYYPINGLPFIEVKCDCGTVKIAAIRGYGGPSLLLGFSTIVPTQVALDSIATLQVTKIWLRTEDPDGLVVPSIEIIPSGTTWVSLYWKIPTDTTKSLQIAMDGFWVCGGKAVPIDTLSIVIKSIKGRPYESW